MLLYDKAAQPLDFWPGPTLDGAGGIGTDAKIVGTDGDDYLEGGDADDVLKGRGGFDVLHGGAGDDTLIGGGVNDWLRGDAGDDRLVGGGGDGDRALYSLSTSASLDISDFKPGKVCVIEDGLDGHDTLVGIERIRITANGGDDTITGSRGDDLVYDGGGADRVSTGGGHDYVEDHGGDATVDGGAGDDYLSFWDASGYSGQVVGGHDHAQGGGGVDVIELGWGDTASAATIVLASGHFSASTADGVLSVEAESVEILSAAGGSGDDTIIGGRLDDGVYGGGGDDSVDGGAGDDTLDGGGGNDMLIGGAGDDIVGGRAGDDSLAGGKGHDLYAAGGYDLPSGSVLDFSGFDVGGGTMTVDDHSGGHDLISGFEGVALTGGYGDDTLIGSSGDDRLDGSFGADSVAGGAGDDFIFQVEFDPVYGAPDGDDTFDGGAGVDTLSFAALHYAQVGLQPFGFDIDLKVGRVVSEFTGTDTVSRFEHVIGGIGDDTITGANRAETLEGGGGQDVIRGGGGADLLSGGAAGDVFLYAAVQDSRPAQGDTITDLTAADVIDLSQIDADSTKAGDQAFHLVGALTGHAGQLVLSYDSAAGMTTLVADVDGDGEADMAVLLTGDRHDFTHFLL